MWWQLILSFTQTNTINSSRLLRVLPPLRSSSCPPQIIFFNSLYFSPLISCQYAALISRWRRHLFRARLANDAMIGHNDRHESQFSKRCCFELPDHDWRIWEHWKDPPVCTDIRVKTQLKMVQPSLRK